MHSVPATVPIPGYLPGIWRVDPSRSDIAFGIRFLSVTVTRGRFTKHDVVIATYEDPFSSSVTATIDFASIDTGNARRDADLRRFLKVARYPVVKYSSTGVRHTADGWVVDGELTLQEVTRPASLLLEVPKFAPGQAGSQCAEFFATARLSRRDFGVTFPMNRTVGDGVSISLRIHAVRHR